MTEARPIPTSREQLWGILFEAAEIEHNLMCCYLYAFFSMKDRVEEDLTETELAAINRWRGEILDIAIEEMAHLAIVSNILSSVGAPAHFGRQNFPIPPGYHPAGVVVKLAPFNAETLDHFIYLERPESVELADGEGFAPDRVYTRALNNDRLMSGTFDYATVGRLYASIKDGIHHLAAEIGEARLFVGDPAHQVGANIVSLPNLTTIKCVKSACAGIDAIVRQGEGSDPDEAGSHYQRFLAIRSEYQNLLAARPEFRPGRMAAHNPVMRRPPTPEGKVWINAEPAASLLDLGNALYNHSLRCLSLAYAGVGINEQHALVDAAIDLMRIITPIASKLTELPASTSEISCTAGLSFATLRSLAALPVDAGGIAVLTERLRQIGSQATRLAEERPDVALDVFAAVQAVEALAARLARTSPSTPIVAKPVLPVAEEPASPVRHGVGIEIIEGASLDLIFDEQRCIHSRHCVLGLPQVFKANVEGPWIDPDAATVEDLLTVAHMCPSGAIRYDRKDGGADEAPPPVNLAQLRENGPIGIRAQILLNGTAIGMRATLCRCGASNNKPYCDGSHNAITFRATGEPETIRSEPLAIRNGPLQIEPQTDGPLAVSGNLELCSGTGRTLGRVTSAKLCRCGGSANKPFCDGTHRKIGFKG
jgi:CDGSH-type Zn-finger protein/uncharacterized Fe-S cluster protein YjdI